MIRLIVAASALLLPFSTANLSVAQPQAQVGDTYELLINRESSERTGDTSSSSSNDRDTLQERVIGVRDTGLELEYDLPKDATTQDRAAVWQFPVRVFRPFDGPTKLLNATELEARVDPWLKRGKLTRAACGHWGFTWTAFRVECDPQSALAILERFDLWPDLRDGAYYRDPAARAPGRLVMTAGANGATYVVELAVDPDAVRRARVDSDLVVAEISKKPLAREDAARSWAAKDISGKMTITFETDTRGNVHRRTTVTRMSIGEPGKPMTNSTVTEVLERRLISSRTA